VLSALGGTWFVRDASLDFIAEVPEDDDERSLMAAVRESQTASATSHLFDVLQSHECRGSDWRRPVTVY
jgi:hypothetical protein